MNTEQMKKCAEDAHILEEKKEEKNNKKKKNGWVKKTLLVAGAGAIAVGSYILGKKEGVKIGKFFCKAAFLAGQECGCEKGVQASVINHSKVDEKQKDAWFAEAKYNRKRFNVDEDVARQDIKEGRNPLLR